MPPIETPPNSQPRKRGGQEGNQNATKHGFYAQVLPSAGRARLAQARAIEATDLTEEISETRERLAAALQAVPEKFEIWAMLVRALTRACAVQFAMRPTAAQRLEEASDNVIEDMRKLMQIAGG